MPENPPEGYQRVIPYLNYADCPAAIDFLCSAFGFTERFRHAGPDGKIGHAELSLKDNVVMLASTYPEMDLVSPRDFKGRYSQVLCYVDDVDAHYARAKAAGAQIDAELQDQFYGDRNYRAQDPEGHRWIFSQHIRYVSPEEIDAAVKKASG